MAIYINWASGVVLPPYWQQNGLTVATFEKGITQAQALRIPYQCPLYVRAEDEPSWWAFPFDPVISISGKNTIVRRNVLKVNQYNPPRGSIKEAWSQDDYDINISGVFITEDGVLPEDDIRKLRSYCENRSTLLVDNDLFCLFNINRIAIESYDFPFTKGVENQTFAIKAYSDDMFDLIIENR
jgi:hypothetical protein